MADIEEIEKQIEVLKKQAKVEKDKEFLASGRFEQSMKDLAWAVGLAHMTELTYEEQLNKIVASGKRLLNRYNEGQYGVRR